MLTFLAGLIKNILITIAIVLLALPPFFTGLFFENEMSIHHYLVAIAFLLVMAIPAVPLRSLANSPYFWALAGLTVLYGFSFCNAVYPREALFTWLRHIDYLLTFVLVFLAANIWQKDGQGSKFTHCMLIVLAFTGIAVAVTGILSAQGVISIESGPIAGRLASTFQYPNSFAAYLMATLIITACLALQSVHPFVTGGFAGMVFLSCLAITGSQSRSVLVMLPLVLAIFILGQASRRRAVLLLGIA